MFSDPVKNVASVGIQAGMDIADLGSGSGHYSIEAAKALMSTGRVYAIDAQKGLLSKLKNAATSQGLYNLEVIWGDLENVNGTKLRDSSIDLAFLCNVLFQLENKENIIKEVRRILKPAGKVLIIDWLDSFGGIGPKPKMIVKKETLMPILEKNGFHLDKEVSAGEHHYGLIFKKL